MKKIGFVGTGTMGASMALNLLKAGYEIYVYTRTKSKADRLVEEGAIWCESPKKLAQHIQILITMVGYPHDVEELYLGEEGFLTTLPQNTVAIDMTTSSPALAQKIAQKAKKAKINVLDAPVSGGDIGAKEGTLSIMVGGEKDIYLQVKPIFEAIGKEIIYQGGHGFGQHTKMANQIAIASTMIGMTEAIHYSEKAGLNLNSVLKTISNGAAGSWSLSNLAPRVLKGDYSPGFFIKHFVKDMRIALDEAKQMGLELPGLALAEKMYHILKEKGLSEEGTQALIKHYRQL